MDEVNEVIIRRKPDREPMSFERLKFLCYFVSGMVAEIFGLVIALIFILCAFGVLK